MGLKLCSKCGEEKELEEFHKDSRLQSGRCSQCKTCKGKYDKYYRHKNKDKLKAYFREHYNANKDRIQACNRERYRANKHLLAEYYRKYYQENRGKIREYKRKYKRERWASDPMFALKERCRARTRLALNGQGFSKNATTKDFLGCNYEELVQHLESLFTDGMSWANMGHWHIDHIVPLASAETEEELLTLCHYTNLQPLWAEDNLKKGAKLNWNNYTD